MGIHTYTVCDKWNNLVVSNDLADHYIIIIKIKKDYLMCIYILSVYAIGWLVICFIYYSNLTFFVLDNLC